jgi:hypothetical protein
MATPAELDIHQLLRQHDAGPRLLAKVAALAAGLDRSPKFVPRRGKQAVREALTTEGYTQLPMCLDDEPRNGLVTIVDRLLDAGLPAVFVYLTDAMTELGRQLERSVSDLLHEQYVVIDDVWAWRIARGTAGWPPHRGIAKLLDRQRPELLNTWVALTPTPQDRSCMFFVPLTADPHYPDDLARLEGAAGRAEPLEGGGILMWNANVLHWGGTCALSADGPRVSGSFSLMRADTAPPQRLFGTQDRLRRLDLVARQVVTYGSAQPDVSAAIFEWAQAACAFANLARAAVDVRKEG